MEKVALNARVQVRMTESEKANVQQKAQLAHLTLSGYIRQKILSDGEDTNND